MKADLVLTGGTVVTEHGPEQADVAVRDGRIAAIVARGAERFEADEQIHVTGLHVFPGEREPMARAGALAFKAFVCEAVDWFRATDADLLEGMREAVRLDRPVGVHSENDDITARLRARLRAAGRTDLRAHCESRPEVTEWEAINRVVLLARETGARTHVVHISTGEGIDACTAARRA